jgi:hypothetical protein
LVGGTKGRVHDCLPCGVVQCQTTVYKVPIYAK